MLTRRMFCVGFLALVAMGSGHQTCAEEVKPLTLRVEGMFCPAT